MAQHQFNQYGQQGWSQPQPQQGYSQQPSVFVPQVREFAIPCLTCMDRGIADSVLVPTANKRSIVSSMDAPDSQRK